MKNQLAAALVWMGVSLTTLPGYAANGVTDTEIIIGASLPLEGGFAAVGQETKLGMEACFRAVNDAGGIHGRKIKLVTLNDGYEPVPCVQNTLKLIDEHKAFALCSYVGTPTSVKAMKVWQAKNVPVVGFYTGAGALRQPFNQYNIHVRASYAKEADAIVTAFVKEAGATKIAIFYQNDAFGEAVKSVTEAALTKANLKAVALGSFERNTLDIEKGLADLKVAQPDAIVMVGTYAPLAKFVKSAKAAGLTKTLFHTVSFVGPEAFAKELGDASGNVFVTQVMPPFTDAACTIGQEYIAALKVLAPDATPTFPGFEAYANAKVLTVGLQRSGKDLSVPTLLKSIESITPENELGLQLSYSASDHEGLDAVFITKIGSSGYEIVKDWGALKIAGLK